MENEQAVNNTEVKLKSSDMLTETMMNAVKGMGPWVRFFSILGFVSVVFMLIAGFAMMVMSFVAPQAAGNTGMPMFMMIIFSIVYMIMGALYLIPSLYLFKAASGVVVLKKGAVKEGMEQSLEYMRKFWKFVGIMLIVLLCLYPVFIILMLFGASMSMFG